MTDSSTLLPNVMGISSDCQYNLKPSAVRSRSYRASVATTNKSSFNPGDTAILYVPGGRRNTYLDTTQTYIRFTAKNNDATVSTTGGLTANEVLFNLDNNGACFINRLDIFHGSNLIETLQNYNQLMTVFLDTNINPAQKLGLSTAYGTCSTVGTLGTSNVNGEFTLTSTFTGATATDTSRAGAILKGTTFASGSSVAVNQQLTFCMPIISGCIGLGSEKFLPLGKLNDDIRCEFTFETQNAAVVYSGKSSSPAAWTITSFELELCVVELSDEGQAMVDSYTSPEMPIYIHSNSWRGYSSNIPAGQQGGISILVPARFGSLKTIYLCPRRGTEITSATSYSLSSRINPNFAQYWWRVGSALLPAKYVVLESSTGSATTGGYAEAFMELQKTFHSVSSPENASCLPISIYNVRDSSNADVTAGVLVAKTGKDSYQNGFLIGQELESFALRSDVLLSGYNTLSQQVFFEAQINTATAVAYTFNFFAGFDQILVIENGIMSVRF